MKRVLLLALLSKVLWGQGASAPPLPTDWYGAGVTYGFNTSPKTTGGFTEASLLSEKAQLYSYTTWDIAPVKVGGVWQYQSSERTGVCELMKNYSPFYFFGCGDIGAATTSKNASLATATEGVVVWKIGKTQWTIYGKYGLAYTGAQGGSRTSATLGIGRTF